MNFNKYRNQAQQVGLSKNDNVDIQKEDLKKKLEIMKLYTSRNNDSRTILKSIVDLKQKQNNVSTKIQSNYMQSSVHNKFHTQYQFNDKQISQNSDIFRQTQQQTSFQTNKNNVDQRSLSPSKKVITSYGENFNIITDFKGQQKFQLQQNQSQKSLRAIKAQQSIQKIQNIALGSYNSTSSKLILDDVMSPKSLKYSPGSNQNILPYQNTTSYLINQKHKPDLLKNFNLTNSNQIPAVVQSTKNLSNQNFFKSIKNLDLQGLQNKKRDKSIDLSSSHQSTAYLNQMSPSSRSGQIKENLTTQESNHGDQQSDYIIQNNYDSHEKRKKPKFNSNVKQFFDDDASTYHQSQRFHTEGSDQNNSKKKFYEKVNKIILKQQDKKNPQQAKQITQTEINVFKIRNQGKLFEEMSPKSQNNLIQIAKYQSQSQKQKTDASPSLNSSKYESQNDENLSVSMDSILTQEMENIELYKQRLSNQKHKFHKIHLMRLSLPKRRSFENLNTQNDFLSLVLNEDSPTKKANKINAFLQAQREKPEAFNIFGQYNDFSRQLQQKFKETVYRLEPSRDIVKYVDHESKKFHQKISTMSAEKNIEMYKQSYKNLAETTINAIQKMTPLFETGLQCINDRNSLDQILNGIMQESLKTKNQVVQILCSKAYAKISKLNKNYTRSIELYKTCKNCSEIPSLFNYKLSCYKNLGYCFSRLKMYDFAMYYFCKMLRIAWYQNDQDAELKAYDLIGMQYYYQGKLEIAQYYHNKMIQGDYEKHDSNLRRLGISKVENKLRQIEEGVTFSDSMNFKSNGLKKPRKYKQQNNDPDNSYDFTISSESEEDFELPIPSKSYKEQTIKDNQKKSNTNLNFNFQDESEAYNNQVDDGGDINSNNQSNMQQNQRKFKKNQPLFYHKDVHQLQQITDQANKNIHIAALQNEKKKQIISVHSKNINASSFKQIKGSTKIPYRINHLSVNRELDNYQNIDGRITKLKYFNFNEQMYDQYEKPTKQKIKQIFENLRDNLLFSMSVLEMQIQKLKSPAKRKAAFMVNPQYGQESNYYFQRQQKDNYYQQ
ncbi:hypothetical protein TTHERM_00530700 (macronuclear) [Tetrahymena thermophila SB210]|uniref:Tetratricopeptide repeat protein n=1 Tax=Tetrahymena thermophila (strain SB210) TaxID=312017 RepID=I7LZX9_TETTS|nr:hypothetical protein TTHERM_00530700 [Tetrahymena thermophila SB210]EAR85112.1 hypothetical protein TTHERM_00530700 [Tetrahymena thermophila SB210]|eukprot:XP_001032775.1 hypothetical protein TTHERM_00530700 [Tetrahymena thermophila SB210]